MTQDNGNQGVDTRESDDDRRAREHPVNCCVAAQGGIPAHLTKSDEEEFVD